MPGADIYQTALNLPLTGPSLGCAGVLHATFKDWRGDECERGLTASAKRLRSKETSQRPAMRSLVFSLTEICNDTAFETRVADGVARPPSSA